MAIKSKWLVVSGCGWINRSYVAITTRWLVNWQLQPDPDRDVYVVTLRVKGEHGVSGDCIIIGTTGSLVRMASTTSVLVQSEDAEAFVDLTVLQPPSSSWQWDSWAPGRATHTSKRILRGYLPTWNTVDVCGRRIIWKARAGMGVTAVVEGNVNYSTKNSSIRERQSVLDTVNWNKLTMAGDWQWHSRWASLWRGRAT